MINYIGRTDRGKTNMKLKKVVIAAFMSAVMIATGSAGVRAAQTAPGAGVGKRDAMVSISSMASAANLGICMVDTEDHSVWMREKKNDYTLLAGMPGSAGYADGALTQARFDSPWSVIAYGGGYLVSDTGNHVIRRIRGGQVTTFAGAAGKPGTKVGSCAASRFREPTGLFYYKGVLYVADSGNHRICSIANGKVEVVAGRADGTEGDAGGDALQATLSNPQQIVMYKGVLYIADTGNGCIKRLKGGKIKTILEANSRREGRVPVQPRALLARNGHLYLGDMFTGELYRIRL